MLQDKMDITVLVDRSGSMTSIRKDMEGAFNTFLQQQANVAGECVVSMYTFDQYGGRSLALDEQCVAKSIDNVSPLRISPRGMTPLYDALGTVITKTGERLSNTPEHERPERVLFVIITDGYENASSEYTVTRIAEMIKEQTETYSWQFIYLGANQDAIGVGTSLGISADAGVTYAATKTGVSGMGSVLSRKIRAARCCSIETYKSGEAVKFNTQDRKECMGIFTG